MSRPMADPLRDKIAACLRMAVDDADAQSLAGQVMMHVRTFATSDAAVEAAADAYFAAPDGMSLRAAITAALGGEP